MTKERISVQKVKTDLNQIINKKISRAWKGYGSALFLELGELHNELAWEKGGKPAVSLTGEWTLSSDGAWNLIKANKETVDIERLSSVEVKDIIKGLEGLTIKSITVTKKLLLYLSNNVILEFNKAEYGFFTLVSNEKKLITYEDDLPYMQQVTL